jgi:hypothetical protein
MRHSCSAFALAVFAGFAVSAPAAAQIVNGGFESGTLSGWTVGSAVPPPVITSVVTHSGTFSALLGTLSGGEPLGDASIYQAFTVPSTGLALTFWYKTDTTDTITFDWQDAYIQNASGTTLATIFHLCQTAGWQQGIVNLDPYVGQTIRIAFLVHQDGFGDDTSMNVDEVAIGPAPVMGACCLPLAQGCILTTAAGCTAQGGTYHGDNSTCATANCPGPTAGPDVVVGEVYDMSRDGALGTITAYSIGTDACNLGDVGVTWVAGTNQHPVITGNMFRLSAAGGASRFEQLGMSWCKHGFFATNSNFCGPCNTPGGDHLGPGGCSDIYTAGLNGSQGGLGARSEVNATTGFFPYPPVLQGNTSVIGMRCQVFTADIDPAQNAGALYFADAHYIVPDDATWSLNGANATNGLNNVSYRQLSITSVTTTPTFLGLTHAQSPGIQAWKDQDSTVTLVNADYLDSSTATNIVSRFVVGGKATNLGGGVWHYEYAIYNINADRSGGSFSVPIPAGAQVSNIGFHAPQYHSGEPYDNTAWTSSLAGGALTWTPAPFSPATNANALRWGTMYNFRFDANVGPGTGNATLGLFKPGTPTSVSVTGIPVPGGTCYANCDGSTTPPVLTVNDFICFQNRFAAGDPYANCDGSTTPPVLNVNDFLCFQSRFAAGCSTP